MKPNLAVNRTVLGAVSPASAAGNLARWASTIHSLASLLDNRQ